jgi:hypothetical protein
MTTHQSARGIREAFTLVELEFLLFAFLCAVIGCSLGIKFGSSYGIQGKVIGGIVGSMAGVAAVALATLIAVLVYDHIWRRWRPYPPVCENGTCMGLPNYKTTKIPEDVLATVKGLSSLGWRCTCGNVYAGGYAQGLQNRWVRVLPDAKIRPYLKHRMLGRWKPDDALPIGPGRIERAVQWLDRHTDPYFQAKIPGWVIPGLMAVITGGLAFVVVWSESGLTNPNGPWFVIVVAFLGFVLGCIAWWLGPG